MIEKCPNWKTTTKRYDVVCHVGLMQQMRIYRRRHVNYRQVTIYTCSYSKCCAITETNTLRQESCECFSELQVIESRKRMNKICREKSLWRESEAWSEQEYNDHANVDDWYESCAQLTGFNMIF